MTTTHTLRRTAMIGALLLTATACGSIRGEAAAAPEPLTEVRFVEPDAEDIASEAQRAAIAEGRPVVEIAEDDSSSGPFAFTAGEFETGEIISGTELYDRGLVLLEFSLPSCPVCHTEAPKILSSARLNPDVTYVIVHSGSTDEEIAAFVDEHELRAPNIVHLVDPDRTLWIRFGVTVQPYYVLVDTDGALSGSTGALGDHGLERAIDRLRTGA